MAEKQRIRQTFWL